MIPISKNFNYYMTSYSYIFQEIKNCEKEKKIKACPNILMQIAKEKSLKNIVNPCFGDPSARNVWHGGFLGEGTFIKPCSFFYDDEEQIGFLKAGPRLHIAFEPHSVKSAIVTCGGLCPGLNVVIRELVMSLWYNYGVRQVYGIQWGFEGFYDGSEWINLLPLHVRDIHLLGGTILGTSRGGFDAGKIIDSVVEKGVNMIFAIGGDGTHKGIEALYKEILKRKLKIVICGIPKTIDNDIPFIDRSFGFESSVEQAVKVIQAANVEARSNKYGLGLVKLFGRECGFIALEASLASRDVNICLIPESHFNLYGENGLLNYIFERLKIKKHCVIVIAEGSASAVLDKKINIVESFDKSGNPVLPDIGIILKDEILHFAKRHKYEIALKYIDPTYIIRTCAANSFDKNYCSKLAQNAVHSAFAGYTNFTSGYLNNKPVIIPVEFLNKKGKRKILINKDLDYLSLLASTGQPSFTSKRL
jgi:6-phosphofructokinase 1